LKVDGRIVPGPPELAHRCEERSPAASVSAIVDDETPVDDRHEVEDLPVLRAHKPVDARGRKRAAKRRGNRYGVYDVAERAETNEQDAGQLSSTLSHSNDKSRREIVVRLST
jgi:hypothetical protein